MCVLAMRPLLAWFLVVFGRENHTKLHQSVHKEVIKLTDKLQYQLHLLTGLESGFSEMRTGRTPSRISFVAFRMKISFPSAPHPSQRVFLPCPSNHTNSSYKAYVHRSCSYHNRSSPFWTATWARRPKASPHRSKQHGIRRCHEPILSLPVFESSSTLLLFLFFRRLRRLTLRFQCCDRGRVAVSITNPGFGQLRFQRILISCTHITNTNTPSPLMHRMLVLTTHLYNDRTIVRLHFKTRDSRTFEGVWTNTR